MDKGRNNLIMRVKNSNCAKKTQYFVVNTSLPHPIQALPPLAPLCLHPLQAPHTGKGLIRRPLAGQSPGNLDILLSFRRDRISATHPIRVLNFLQRCGNDTLLFRLTTAGFRMDETESIAEQKH
jgi:hypothetical protein